MNDQFDLNNNKANDPIAELMQHGLVEMPFSDFDHRMMVSIRREAVTISHSKRDKSRAYLFFMLGCFFGLCMSAYIGVGYAGVTAMNGGILWQVTTVVFFYLLLGSAYKRALTLHGG